MRAYLDFEKPVAELEAKVEELKALASNGGVPIGEEVLKLEVKAAKALADIYKNLTPWERTLRSSRGIRCGQSCSTSCAG